MFGGGSSANIKLLGKAGAGYVYGIDNALFSSGFLNRPLW
jgi:hypothetical protein